MEGLIRRWGSHWSKHQREYVSEEYVFSSLDFYLLLNYDVSNFLLSSFLSKAEGYKITQIKTKTKQPERSRDQISYLEEAKTDQLNGLEQTLQPGELLTYTEWDW